MYGDDRRQIISKKKPKFPVNDELAGYLIQGAREIDLPLKYQELTQFDQGFPILDRYDNDTLWLSVLYNPGDTHRIHEGLKAMYSILKTEGNSRVHRNLQVERIDYCTFGNSKPFRIKIVNTMNENHDYFYVKPTDASRIYGLELDHILSPFRINFFVDDTTLLEEHIAGVPGDVFINTYMNNLEYNKVRIAKELVKFNERCFVRFLGDMRSYNYVFDITPDFEEVQFRIRAIDFDQQSYEGRKNLYLPQFFKENYPLVKLVQEYLTLENVEQYQKEERVLIARRSKAARKRLDALLTIMERDVISVPEKVRQLREEVAEHYKDDAYLKCESMGAIVRRSISTL